MKTIFILCICLTASISQAQTAIIAHKSHSGAAESFFTDPSTNFGDPGPQLIQIVRLNDSTYVHVMAEFSGFIYHDTMRYKKQEAKILDSLYERDKDHIELINFKHSPDSLKIKPPTQDRYHEMKIKPQQEVAPRKKKKSYLLFLFGITGGGMLLMRFFGRILRPQVIS